MAKALTASVHLLLAVSGLASSYWYFHVALQNDGGFGSGDLFPLQLFFLVYIVIGMLVIGLSFTLGNVKQSIWVFASFCTWFLIAQLGGFVGQIGREHERDSNRRVAQEVVDAVKDFHAHEGSYPHDLADLKIPDGLILFGGQKADTVPYLEK